MSLAWPAVNLAGFGPKTHQLGGFEAGDKPGAQWVGFSQTATTNTLKKGNNDNNQPEFD